VYIQHEDKTVRIIKNDTITFDKLQPRNWLLKLDQIGFYLEEVDAFKFPKTIYGNPEQLANRYLNTFKERDQNLGILLAGMKGTGKSITGKLIASMAQLPTIIISEPYFGGAFKSFLTSIKEECVIFIDEFEKIFGGDVKQMEFLSILDGVFEGKKLWIFTSNAIASISAFMRNRPGRILYLQEYRSIDDSIIDEIIEKRLNNKEHRKNLIEVITVIGNVSMDVLLSLIEEMNRYKETASQALKFLNIQAEHTIYEVTVKKGNLKLFSSYFNHNPLTSNTFVLDGHIDGKTFAKLQQSMPRTEEIANKREFTTKAGDPHPSNNREYFEVEFVLRDCDIQVDQKKKLLIITNPDGFSSTFVKREPWKFIY
jgi:hypothetical protein